jgi:glycosyltransferase involved in cell wall biosynthesis
VKLLHVISSANPENGGPIEGVRQLQAPLEALGISTEIACSDAPDAPWLASHPLKNIHALGPSRLRYSYAADLLPWLRDHAARFDAVIVEGIWQYHSFAAWRALAGTKTPYFVFTHGMLDPWFKHTYPLKHLKKWLYWPWSDYRVLRDAKAVLFTCEDERLLARQSFWLYRAKERIVSYGTSRPPQDENGTLAAQFIAAYPQLAGKRLLLFLSRIHEKKGCDLLLDAFAMSASSDPRLHLVMAGPDKNSLAASLKERALKIGIAERITWTGMLEAELKWGAFHAAEVFCLPSHQENFGIVVAEALACGKPVLISNKVNIWREIEKDAAGFIDEDTMEGTSRNIRKWLALGPEEYAAMRERARQCFASRFHINTVAGNMAEVIQSTMRKL